MTTSQIHIAAQDMLFREGDVGDAAYLVDQGRIAILRERNGQSEKLGEIAAGECVGEMALISNDARLASAQALEDTRLTVITRQHLDERMAHSDPLVRHLLQIVLKRYRQSLGQFPAAGMQAISDQQDETLAMQRMRTEHALSHALKHGEFVLYFQPIVRLADRVTAGFEALLRWRKPDGQLIAPDLFIPVAEESCIIESIGQWIIHEAARRRAQLPAAWDQPLDADFSISINLAARQFRDPQLVSTIGDAIEQNQLKPQHLRMEVTESQIVENWQQALAILRQIKAMGCKVAIDDFGTGHSSLAYLNQLPVDTLKIDKAFLQDMLTDSASRSIIGGMVRLASDLKLTFIAEGAETEAQIQTLQSLGVEHVQGFYFGRPFGLD